jgi:hypothetical protein
MLLLRCTRKLLRRTVPLPEQKELESTTKLGDWTANVLITRQQHVVLAVSNVTLLPVLLPISPASTVLARIPAAIADVLRALGLAERKVAAEVRAMSAYAVTVTNDRRVLGSMNDFGRMIDSYLDHRSFVEVALLLAQAPCSPIGMASPRDATMARFAARELGPASTASVP